MRITDKEIKNNNVKSAPDMLTALGETSTQDVKHIFDRLPELVAAKHNKLVDFVSETLKSPESAQFDIQLFTNPAQFGTSYDAPMADIYAAMPKNSLAFLNPSKLTDESWNLPEARGMVEIKKGEDRGKIVLWTRVASAGDWAVNFDGSNQPTGVWTKYLNSVDGSQLSELAARANEIAEEAKQLGYDGINRAKAAQAAVDSAEADLGIVAMKQLDRVAVESGTVTLAGSVTLEAGSYIVQFGGYFATNDNGYRRIYLSANANPTTSTPARQRQILQNAVGNGKATYMYCTTFITVTSSATLSVCVQQDSGEAVNFDGYIHTMQITGNTTVMPDLSGGGDVDIFG